MDSELQAGIANIQSMYRDEPDKAKINFTTSSTLQGRFRSEVEIRTHRITVDEPQSIGGSDLGPSPVELVLAALGSCQEITYRAFATAMGITLDAISVEMHGDIDFRGFFAVDERVRPGFERISATVTIESDASPEALEQLRERVNAHCPVLDVLRNPVPVSLEMRNNKTSSRA